MTNPPIAESVDAFIAHQRNLGLRYRSSTSVLRGFQRWAAAENCQALDAAAYLAWSDSLRHLHPNSRRKAQQVLRRFCLYRATHEPDCFVPSTDSFARARPYAEPTIVTPKQISRVLAAADALPEGGSSPFTPAAARLAVVLLYTTGMRRNELVQLRVGDVQASRDVLFVADSKFHRSRFVPLSRSTAQELGRYLRIREQLSVGRIDTGHLLAHPRGRRLTGYSPSGLVSLLRRVFRAAGVTGAGGRSTPRCHDLRHSFAVQSLLRGYRTGGDVQAWLPKLAVYMGHVSIESTAYYLRLVPEVAALASERYRRQYGHLGEEPPP